MTSKRTRQRVAVGALVLAATLSASPAVAGTSSAKKHSLASMLLRIGQLPVGWSTASSSSSSGVGCLASVLEPTGFKQTASASASFVDNGNVPAINEKLATYRQPARAAYRKIVATLDHCKNIKGSNGGQHASGTIGQMSFPKLGNQSAAFDINLTISGTSAGADLIVARVGSVVLGVEEIDLGSPDISQFERYARLAVTKLRS